MESKSPKRNPLVSIVIPVYNGADFMREAIDSALNQTYENIEVLVVNDGSSDGGKTAETARSYGNKIRYFEKENGGVSSAVNLGIKNMRGEYFSWLSHDDVYLPGKIEHQMELLKQFSFDDSIMAMCRADFIDADSNVIRDTKSSTKEISLLNWKDALIRLIKDGCFIGCNLLIPKKAFYEIAFFDESLRYIQDFWMWIQLFSNKYSLLCGMDIDVHSRVHGGQLTQTGNGLFVAESTRIGEAAIPLLSKISGKDYNFLYQYTLYCAKYGLKENVRECKKAAKKTGLFSVKQKMVINAFVCYSSVRPFFRTAYYKLIKKKRG